MAGWPSRSAGTGDERAIGCPTSGNRPVDQVSLKLEGLIAPGRALDAEPADAASAAGAVATVVEAAVSRTAPRPQSQRADKGRGPAEAVSRLVRVDFRGRLMGLDPIRTG